tara:strand:+ start:457 stop:624 length:168 start_codon:yes stop_codon:yes gene_type:complete
MSCSLPHHISTDSSKKTFTIENPDSDSKVKLDDLVINTTDVDETTKIYNINPYDL